MTVQTVAWFNALDDAEATAELLACCAAIRWARAVADGRPYRDVQELLAAGDAALAELAWSDIAQALAAHPRIGERASGTDRESAWSRREQAGVDDADAERKAALAAANRAYEERFDHIFLIFASGRSDLEMLAAARARLANDEATERQIVRGELAKIARLRLGRLFA